MSVLFLWLFKIDEPFLSHVERSHVFNLRAAEKDLSPTAPDLHMQDLPVEVCSVDHDLLRFLS